MLTTAGLQRFAAHVQFLPVASANIIHISALATSSELRIKIAMDLQWESNLLPICQQVINIMLSRL